MSSFPSKSCTWVYLWSEILKMFSLFYYGLDKEFFASPSNPTFSQIWGCYSQYNLISRIRNFTTLQNCTFASAVPNLLYIIQLFPLSFKFFYEIVSLRIASFVSRSSIFMFVLQILINDFLCLSHRLMYKSSTSVTEVIQRKSACSYLCLPNSCFNFSVPLRISG